MAKTIHTDKAPKAIGPYVQGKIVATLFLAPVQFPLPRKTGKLEGGNTKKKKAKLET